MANANDPFDNINVQSLRDPPDSIYVITPSDSVDLAPAVRSLRAGSNGNIQVNMRGGTNPVVLAFLAGETRYGRFTRVWATNTTVTEIEGGV